MQLQNLMPMQTEVTESRCIVQAEAMELTPQRNRKLHHDIPELTLGRTKFIALAETLKLRFQD